MHTPDADAATDIAAAATVDATHDATVTPKTYVAAVQVPVLGMLERDRATEIRANTK